MAKKRNKGKIIAVGAGLEGFVDCVGPNVSNPTEEKEDNMSSLAVGFAAGVLKGRLLLALKYLAESA